MKHIFPDPIIIYTDGSCITKTNDGGWGATLAQENFIKEIYGGMKDTSNNRMELTAAIKALQELREPAVVELYTDSKYLIDGINKCQIWEENHWTTCNKSSSVKNKDLWEELATLASSHVVNFHWIKGHSGNLGNERADFLADLGVKSLNQYTNKEGNYYIYQQN
jgi:ribonuclease HI